MRNALSIVLAVLAISLFAAVDAYLFAHVASARPPANATGQGSLLCSEWQIE
jgi:hypothetical protein